MAFLFYFSSMNRICLNGKYLKTNQPVLMCSNRGFRYGDALFETMKIINGKIVLSKYHFERLFSGLRMLQFRGISTLSKGKLAEQIIDLCFQNHCAEKGRARLTVFRGNGGLNESEEKLQYLVEAVPLTLSSTEFNERGFQIGIYSGMQKSCDSFSNLKSANYLPSVMTALFAKKHKWNDSLCCNVKGGIADASIANVFLVKKRMIITPALTEGCVNGVMRRYLVEQLSKTEKYEIREGIVTINDVKDFDEFFLTNAIYGMRWVKQFGNKTYQNTQAATIYEEFIKPMNS